MKNVLCKIAQLLELKDVNIPHLQPNTTYLFDKVTFQDLVKALNTCGFSFHAETKRLLCLNGFETFPLKSGIVSFPFEGFLEDFQELGEKNAEQQINTLNSWGNEMCSGEEFLFFLLHLILLHGKDEALKRLAMPGASITIVRCKNKDEKTSLGVQMSPPYPDEIRFAALRDARRDPAIGACRIRRL